MFANLGVLFWSLVLAEKLEAQSPGQKAVCFLLLRLLFIQAIVLVMGMTGGLSAIPIETLGIVLLLGAIPLKKKPLLKFPLWPFGKMLAVLACVLLLRSLLQVWFFCPYQGDALSYHLPKVAEWIQAGRFTREMGVDKLATLPAGFELVETWWTVFLHHDVLIEMAGVEFLLLACVSVYAIARSLGLSEKPALLASLLYAVVPQASFQATSCLNDGPVAAVYLATVAMVLGKVDPVTLLIPVGLGAGLKGTFIYALPGIVLLFALRRRIVGPVPLRRVGLALCALSLVVGGFWYARNLIWFGNPFYPVGKSGVELGMVRIQVGPSLESLRSNISDLLGVMILDRTKEYAAMGRNTSVWGPLFLGLSIPSFLYFSRIDREFRQTVIAFLVSTACVCLMIAPDGYISRFVLFLPALGCVAAVKAAVAHRVIAVPLAWAALFSFAHSLFPVDFRPKVALEVARQSWRDRTYAPYASLELPSGDAVAFWSGNDGHFLCYPLYRPDFSRRVVYFGDIEYEELVRKAKEMGIRQVVIARNPQWRAHAFFELIKQGRARQLGPVSYELLESVKH